MNETRLHDFPVRNLQYIFSPPGLPLVVKGKDPHGSTSLLVRGGAGAGKTTLGVALAHAIARAGEGVVLYLTTEFSPAEIAYKARLVGLGEAKVAPWPGEGDTPVGALLVEHLALVKVSEEAGTTTERRRSAMEAVWELLHGEGQPARAVRVVVIDAFALPEGEESDPRLRGDLVAFVQALENQGISTVLIAEHEPGIHDWLGFVVDVVLEVRHTPDEHTGELRRKLSCTKSRYTTSLPGPHDYGMEARVPAVWPDLFRVLTAPFGSPFPGEITRAPGFLVPLEGEDECVRLGAGLVLSPYDSAGRQLTSAIQRTPGIRLAGVSCGSLSTIFVFSPSTPGEQSIFIPDDDGIHAIAWSLLRRAQEQHLNACLIQGFEELLARPGWHTPILHFIEALRLIGYLVCVHGPQAGMTALVSTANVVGLGGNYSGETPIRRRRSLHQARHFIEPPILKKLASGAEVEATHNAFDAITKAKPSHADHLAWAAVCATQADNATAIDELKSRLGSADGPQVLDSLLRALAFTGRLNEADQVIDEFVLTQAGPPWLAARLQADTRLDSQEPAAIEDAIVRLHRLAEDIFLEPSERAEIHHNLGVAYWRREQLAEARSCWEQALLLDADLAEARQMLEESAQTSGPHPG